MFSKHSFSLPAFDDLITGAICLALLSEFVSGKNLTGFLLWENLLCFQTAIITAQVSLLSLQLSVLYSQPQWSQNTVLSTSGTDTMELPNVAKLPKQKGTLHIKICPLSLLPIPI